MFSSTFQGRFNFESILDTFQACANPDECTLYNIDF